MTQHVKLDPVDLTTDTSHVKVWRVPLLTKELMACGFDPAKGADWNWESVMKPMLVKKGLPHGFTLDRTPARMSPMPKGKGIMLEFQ